MDVSYLVSLYFERSNAMQTYWNFYITIELALVAFFGSVFIGSIKPGPRIVYVASILTVAFIAFAYVNHDGLKDVALQRLTARDLIKKSVTDLRDAAKGDAAKEQQANVAEQILAAIKPPEVKGVTSLHLVGDILTVIAIWLLVLSGLWKTGGLTTA